MDGAGLKYDTESEKRISVKNPDNHFRVDRGGGGEFATLEYCFSSHYV